jgi:hypothetical protein
MTQNPTFICQEISGWTNSPACSPLKAAKMITVRRLIKSKFLFEHLVILAYAEISQ